MGQDEGRLLDRHEAAELLSISPRRLSDRSWRHRFALPAVKVGGSLRFERPALIKWLEHRREQGAAA